MRKLNLAALTLCLAACELSTVPAPLDKLCERTPTHERCLNAIATHCEENPDDQEWCADASASVGEGGCCPDGGVADSSTPELDAETPASDGGEPPLDTGTQDAGDAGRECAPCDDGERCDTETWECVRDTPPEGCQGNSECTGGFCVQSSCVDCRDAADCSASKPTCSGANECGMCSSRDDCTRYPDAPACDPTGGGCVECVPGADESACSGDTHCAPTLTCEQCADDDHCDAAKPVCSSSNECEGCATSGDCAGYADTPACDPNGGGCVECVPFTNEVCPDNSHCAPTLTCEQCAQDEHCDADNPVCSSSYECEGCASRDDCSTLYPEKPACDPGGSCVECVPDVDEAACEANSKVCKTDDTICVQCNSRQDCPEATPGCNASNDCDICTSDDDCTRFGKVCNTGNGLCVECLPDADDPTAENCSNGNACHPDTLTCTAAPRLTLSDCNACVSDSECLAGLRCVPTSFDVGPHGNYCLQIAPIGACPNTVIIKQNATSTLGVEANYCFPKESITTCEVLADYQTLCLTDADCGCMPDDTECDGGVQGGRCIGADPDNSIQGECSHRCQVDRDCRSDSCQGPFGSEICEFN